MPSRHRTPAVSFRRAAIAARLSQESDRSGLGRLAADQLAALYELTDTVLAALELTAEEWAGVLTLDQEHRRMLLGTLAQRSRLDSTGLVLAAALTRLALLSLVARWDRLPDELRADPPAALAALGVRYAPDQPQEAAS